MVLALALLAKFIFLGLSASFDSRPSWHWTWTCENERCVKNPFPVALTENMTGATLDVCKLNCGRYGSLWPQPTGNTFLGRDVVAFHPSKVKFDYSDVEGTRTTREYLQRVSKIFQSKLLSDCGYDCSFMPETEVTLHYNVTSSDLRLNWETDESYELDVATSGNNVVVRITSKTVYGSRHALETLAQLVAAYVPRSLTRTMRHLLVMVSSVKIADGPVYPHRGLLLDTARNFMSVSTIQRTLDGMAMAKLNVLHWHVTDSQSFPLETPRVPQIVRHGAYSAGQVYTVHDTAAIIEYARLRGIRVIVEVDAPAHAGNGWQWGESSNLGKLAVCVNQQPWREYCIQPPCGQLNPVNPRVYEVLRDIYADVIDMTPPGEPLHMGGDEVFFPCWNSSSEIVDWMENNGLSRTEEGFLELWGIFQKKVLQVFDAVNPVSNTPAILWSSHLTHPKVIETFLDKNRYIIQTWVEASDPIPHELLNKGYKLIMATKDTWYLDHGFWGRTVYHNWRVAYDNKLPRHRNVLGGEATMWSELVDDHSVDVKVWPRAAAVSERLWSDPESGPGAAEPRIQQFRQRLVKKGINADVLSPLYCYQNEGDCF